MRCGGIRLRKNGPLPIQGVSRFVRAKRTTGKADLRFSIGLGGSGGEKSEKIAVSRGARLRDTCAALHMDLARKPLWERGL